MKQSKWALTALLALLFVGTGFSQKVMLVSGDLSFLKGQKDLNVEYDFSEFAVGDYNSEGEYKAKKIKEHNSAEAGKGDKWSASWENAKTHVYPAKFEELANAGLSKGGMKVTQGNDAASYTLIVKTTFIEPGFNVGVMKKPAAVSFEYIFVDKKDPSKELAKLTHRLVPGSQFGGNDYDAGTRIAESYAKGGKMLAATMAKSL